MKLTKIETKTFKNICDQLTDINDSSLVNYDKFYEEDCEFRLDKIDEMISLLNKEKELINDLIGTHNL
jgi:hypothetical protein